MTGKIGHVEQDLTLLLKRG